MDPRQEPEPNFQTHEVYRELIRLQTEAGSSPEEALQAARNLWVRDRDNRAAAWLAAQEAGQDGNAAAGGDAPAINPPVINPPAVNPPAANPPAANSAVPPPAASGAFSIADRDDDLVVDSDAHLQPGAPAMALLRKKAFVPLYHFLPSSCREAFEKQNVTTNDTVSFQISNNTMSVVSGNGQLPTKGVIPDEKLSYEDFHAAQPVLLQAMTDTGYNPVFVQDLANFFGALDRHPVRLKRCGTKAIQRYAGTTRLRWHNVAEAAARAVDPLNRPKIFNIGRIDEKGLEEARAEIIVEESNAATAEQQTQCVSLSYHYSLPC